MNVQRDHAQTAREPMTHYAIKRCSDGTFFLQSATEEVVGDREFNTKAGAEAYRRERLKKDEQRRSFHAN